MLELRGGEFLIWFTEWCDKRRYMYIFQINSHWLNFTKYIISTIPVFLKSLVFISYT